MIDDQRVRLLSALRRGMSLRAACLSVGLKANAFARLLKRDNGLRTDVTRAQAEAELILVHQMHEHAKTDYHAAAWLLARTNPAKYGKEKHEELTDEEVREIW